MTIPTWLCWTLGIVIGVPAMGFLGLMLMLDRDYRNGRNPFE